MTTLKNDKYEEFIIPNYFYCTFMEGEGQYSALKNETMDFDGHKVLIKESKNPSDIIW